MQIVWRERLVWGGAVLAAALAVAGVYGVHRLAESRRRAVKVEARRTFLARFGIASDGTQDFVALPPTLPHAAGPSRLGEDLFCDRRLAQSQRRRCAACHCLNEGGVDGQLHGGVLTRTVMNAVFSPVFLHDGSLTNLGDVVVRMIERREFAGGGTLDKVVSRLGADEKLLARFRANYETGLVGSNVVDALVQNFRTVLTRPQTPFDRYWNGRSDALDATQKRGMELFRTRGCLNCHDGPALGGLRVSEGRKVPTLRGLGYRKVFLTDGSLTELGAVLARMPGGSPEDEGARAALVAFLKSL